MRKSRAFMSRPPALCSTKLILVTVLFVGAVQCSYLKVMWSSRYMRNSMGRVLLEQMANDECEDDEEYSKWYNVNLTMIEDNLKEKFVQSSKDEETQNFLNNCQEKSDAVFTQCGHTLFKSFTSLFFSLTTINGILGRGSMFVFSRSQLQSLLGADQPVQRETMIDLGAGDGKVTAMMESFFKRIFVTEQSPSMRWRLKDRGYEVVEIDDWPSQQYDVISCLNLLDRCDRPLTILSDIHKSLVPETGRAIVAVVLPFDPCVEKGSKIVSPTERLPLRGQEFEAQVNSFMEDVFKPAGFEVETWTRLPYLCEGDLFNNYYILDDAVFVLKPVDRSSPSHSSSPSTSSSSPSTTSSPPSPTEQIPVTT